MRRDALAKRRAVTLIAAGGTVVVMALTSRWWLPALPTLFGGIEANSELIGAFADLTTIATFVMLLIGGALAYLGFRSLQSGTDGQNAQRSVDVDHGGRGTAVDDVNCGAVIAGDHTATLTYRGAFVGTYSRIEVPGTNLSGSVERLFFWPTLRETRLEDVRIADYESEDPRYQLSSVRGSIDLRNFPNSALERAIIVAGAGFGKTALLSAVGHRLGHTTWLPALISLPELADSGDTVVEFLNNHVNKRFGVSLSWDPYCNTGRAVLLFDGLDELAPGERRRVLGLIQDFSSRYSAVPWLLTVRDAKALAAPVDANVLKIDVFDDTQIYTFAEAYKDAGSAIDVPKFTSQLRAFPDLRLLVRIPLFLALLLATVRPPEPLPRNRSELLEHYLHIALHPAEYKPSVSLKLDAAALRQAAEQLAFEALDGIGFDPLSRTDQS